MDPLTQPEPLTDRLDREGRGRGVRTVVFSAVMIVVAAAINVFALRNLLLAVPHPVFGPGASITITADGFLSEAVFLEIVALAFAGAAYLTVRRPNRQTTMRMLGAKPVAPGQLAVTRSALHDMCLASGVSPTPPLYAIESAAINAVVVGREGKVAVAVTSGLAAAFDRDEQRAVMAHLLARMRIGNPPEVEGMSSLEEQADALAMQALRDPRALLSALERSRGAASWLTMHGSGVFDGFTFLPFLPGLGVAAAFLDRRIARLRAVTGVEGADVR